MPGKWADLSDHGLIKLYLDTCARNLQWTLGNTQVHGDEWFITGWALTLAGPPEEARFLINGMPFEDIQYPMSSPDLEQIFWNIPTAKSARFSCRTTVDRRDAFKSGFACLEFQDGSRPHEVRRRAWYWPDPENDLAIPDDAKIRRVIGVGDRASYVLGGAATYKRVEHYLEQRFSKSFDSFESILDWACGCGRLARHFRWSQERTVCGVDIDSDSIAWCRQHLPFAHFITSSLLPPLPFEDESFDLIFAMSILGQLREDHQFVWLEELKRVASRNALLLVAVPGLTQIGLARPHPALMRDIEEKGFVVTGRNPDLDDILPGQDHYVSGIHSRDYLYMNYGKYFTILDIVDAIAANDDLIVMRNDLDN
jgi:hypothetical protein